MKKKILIAIGIIAILIVAIIAFMVVSDMIQEKKLIWLSTIRYTNNRRFKGITSKSRRRNRKANI